MRILLLALIVALPFEILLLISLWPYLGIVGEALAGLLITCCVCGAIYAVALTRHHIALQTVLLRHADLRSRVIDANGLVVLEQEDGSYRHLSAEQESAKLALPARVLTVTDEKPPPDELQILTLASQKVPYRKIAELCGTNQSRVQKVVAEWKKKHNLV
jgi:hypothetical protein